MRKLIKILWKIILIVMILCMWSVMIASMWDWKISYDMGRKVVGTQLLVIIFWLMLGLSFLNDYLNGKDLPK